MTMENANMNRADVLARLGLTAIPATAGETTSEPDRHDRHTAGGGEPYDDDSGIEVRPGPTGSRAALTGGPDVWEVIAAVHAVCADDPAVCGEPLYDVLAEVTGLDRHRLGVAVRYYAAHPDEIDARIVANSEAASRLSR